MVGTNSTTMWVPPNTIIHVDPNILIQVDATVIAGVLILLTIGSVLPINMNKKISSNLTPSTIVGIVLFPFAFSAICIIYPDFIHESPIPDTFGLIPYAFGFALFSTASGFIYMIFVILAIARVEDIIGKKIRLPKEVDKTRIDQKIKNMKIIKRYFDSRYKRRIKRKKLMLKRYEKVFKKSESDI